LAIEWFILFLPLAAATGWFAGRSSFVKSLDPEENKRSKNYIVGLNYLLNEQPDKAIDTFIELLDVDTETVETHLALGSLFRKRGEVDRALKLHQNIIARRTLSQGLRQLALFELGNDYLSAGVLDRAESIFEELSFSKSYKNTCLKQLLTIFQLTKDWEKAIHTATELQKYSKDNFDCERAHFYCELANEEISKGHLSIASGYLRKALKVDEKSVRVCLMQGFIARKQHQWQQAIIFYESIIEMDIQFVSEALNEIEQCFKAIDDIQGYGDFLQRAVDKGAGTTVILAAANLLQVNQGDKEAGVFITSNLRKSPSLRGLQALIELHVIHASDSAKDSLLLLQELVDELLNSKPNYSCEHCGFESKQLYWQCPSCKNWSTLKPIMGLEGE